MAFNGRRGDVRWQLEPLRATKKRKKYNKLLKGNGRVLKVDEKALIWAICVNERQWDVNRRSRGVDIHMLIDKRRP